MLDEAVAQGFAGVRHGASASEDRGHGRLETRRVWVTDEVHWVEGALAEPWPHLGSVAVVERVRQDLGDYSGKVSTERWYYLSSRAGTDAAAMAAVRGHWSVEAFGVTPLGRTADGNANQTDAI